MALTFSKYFDETDRFVSQSWLMVWMRTLQVILQKVLDNRHVYTVNFGE
jgi:hypothetical protein